MRFPVLFTVIAALIGVFLIIGVGAMILQPPRALLGAATIQPSTISPNADGNADITKISYELHRNANVTITFTNTATQKVYTFRNNEIRSANKYEVLFSGVVDGEKGINDRGANDSGANDSGTDTNTLGTIETQLIPNGMYEWAIQASAANGETNTQKGTLTVENGDTDLPAITDFTLSPTLFTPNQDGVDDRININLYVQKDAELTVYLEPLRQDPNKAPIRYYIAERIEGRKVGEKGAHVFNYDGGVDNNITPPPDGDYRVIALAQDRVGQRVSRTAQVTLKDGGLPNAELAAQTVGSTVYWTTLPYDEAYYSTLEKMGKAISLPEGINATPKITMPQGDLLLFRVTVSNYGATPIRTVGPWAGTVYNYDQKSEAMNAEAVTGAWRVGMECERTDSQLPWRWAIGNPDQLEKVERDGEVFWYLPPGKQTVVWGAVRMTRLIPTRNPQECYLSLIHQDVAIPPLQSRVSPIRVELTSK